MFNNVQHKFYRGIVRVPMQIIRLCKFIEVDLKLRLRKVLKKSTNVTILHIKVSKEWETNSQQRAEKETFF